MTEQKKDNPRKIIVSNYGQFVKNKSAYYKTYSINKNSKTHKKRQINEPDKSLKLKQRLFLHEVLYTTPVPVYSSAHGFYRSRSIKTNAQSHVGQELVINMDIKNFFPSINYKRIKNILIEPLESEIVARIYASICVYRNQLPQGSPASPYLSNAVCYEMDRKLDNICKKINVNYTRYADDMTFSGKEKTLMKYLPVIQGLIIAQDFVINEEKTKIMRKHVRQEVTGLIVNKKVNVKRKKFEKVETILYHCKTKGVKKHISYMMGKNREPYITPKRLKGKLWGYANHVNNIDREKGSYLFKKINEIKDW